MLKRIAYSLLPVLFFLLGLFYIWSVPIFESPDEIHHVGMMQYLAENRSLPVQEAGETTIYAQQGSQPPLYYMITALLVAPVDRSDYDVVTERNPHANVGDPSLPGNKNYALHDQVYPPQFEGTSLAVYIARLFSLVCASVTVLAVFMAARVLVPDRRRIAWLAAGIVAFNPQFLFISASVNNDNLVTMFASLTLWQVVAMLRDGFVPRRSMLIAVLVALASLSKLSGLTLVPVVALAGLYVAYRDRDVRGLLTLAGAMAVLWALVAGWWYARNLSLYGELFGNQRMLDVFGRREFETVGAWVRAMLEEFEGLRWSFWGVFGWFNVMAPGWYYLILDGLMVIATIGLLVHLWRSRREHAHLIRLGFLSLALLIGYGALLSWSAQTSASQGRLLFPFVVTIGALMALGLVQLRIPAGLVVLGMGALAVWMPLGTIMPAYSEPPTVSRLPAQSAVVNARFGDAVRLVGYTLPLERYAPGDDVPVTLYWQPLRQTDRDYSVSLHLIIPDGSIVGQVDAYPGWGSLRTTSWDTGTIYRDSYVVRVNEDITGRVPLRLMVRWWPYPEDVALPITGAQGETWQNLVVNAGVVAGPTAEPTLPDMIDVDPTDFGGLFRLRGYTLEGLELTLLWETVGETDENFTVFAQVLDEAGSQVLGQGDRPPELPTRYQRIGERFLTRHHLLLSPVPPPGTYPLYIGWYSPTRPFRLPTIYPDNAFPLTEVVISEGQ